MTVKVFNLTPGPAHRAYLPEDIFQIHGWEGGLDIKPQIGPIRYDQLAGMAIFTRREMGGSKLFLMLMIGGRPRPILVSSEKVHFNDFRLPAATSAVDSMRQLGRRFCQLAGDVVVDQGTLDFVQGKPPSPFENEILQLATAFGLWLNPQAEESPGTTAHRASPAPPNPSARSYMSDEDEIIPLAPVDEKPGHVYQGKVDEEEAFAGYADKDRDDVGRSSASKSDVYGGDVYGGDVYEGDVYEGDVYGGDVYQGAGRPINPYANPKAKGTLEAAPSTPLLTPLFYPLRGSALIALLPVSLLSLFGGGCYVLIVAPVMAGFVFEIIRQTVEGGDSLEGYPNFDDMGARFAEVFAVIILGLIPTGIAVAAAMLLAGEYKEDHLSAGLLSPIILAIWLLCFLLWNIALGSTAAYHDWSFVIRVDLHIRALVKCWKAAQIFLLRIFLLFTLFFLVVMACQQSSSAPVIMAVLLTSSVYLYFAGAHCIGLMFRENRATMESIFLMK